MPDEIMVGKTYRERRTGMKVVVTSLSREVGTVKVRRVNGGDIFLCRSDGFLLNFVLDQSASEPEKKNPVKAPEARKVLREITFCPLSRGRFRCNQTGKVVKQRAAASYRRQQQYAQGRLRGVALIFLEIKWYNQTDGEE